jgi:hypothetical protein
MNHMLVNKSMSNSKMFNSKLVTVNMLNNRLKNINNKILNTNNRILNTNNRILNTNNNINKKIDDSNKNQVKNLTDNVNRLDAKLSLAEKATDEKRRISMRLTSIELYKIESDATKRIGLMRLINNTINPR